jgi:prepilin-type N-terminal cleavage/methylation domain-containing protein
LKGKNIVTNPGLFFKNRKGFTLLEILIVIAMMAVLGAISYPAFTSFSKTYKFRAAGREVLTTAMQARSNAIRDNATWRVEFDHAANKFNLVAPDGSVAVSHDLSSYGHGIKLIGDTESTCGAASKNWSSDPISQTDLITFTGRGFGNSRSIYLEDADNKICLAVSAASSGIARLHRYNGKTPYSVSNWD